MIFFNVFGDSNVLPFCQVFRRQNIQLESSNLVGIYWNLIVNIAPHFTSVMNRTSLCIQIHLDFGSFAQLCYWNEENDILVL